MKEIDRERKMGRIEYGLSKSICLLYSHQWITVTVNGDEEAEQCMRCWDTR